MHNAAQKVGVGAALDLQIWADVYGLAFAFKPPASADAWSIVCGIADGRYDQCSVGCVIEQSTDARQGGVAFDSISRAELGEISICPQGACPGAICWHVGNGPDAVSPAARALLPGWQSGRAAYLAGRAAA